VSDELRDALQATLGAAYTVERELGGGGMSRVFVATELAFNRQVVVKVLPRDQGHLSIERFKLEIATAAKLQHPHIVPLLSAGEVGGTPYFIMPYVSGESLRSRLAAGSALTVTEVTRILRDVTAALAFAHKHGVVHRDIKPDNVLLSDGSAVVTDFGIAKALTAAAGTHASGLTSVGMALGTPAYMAPEQASADPTVDHRADLYAFGCMAYEMLTGNAPFAARAPAQVFAAHLTEFPVPLATKRTDVPVALAKLIMRCLEKNPADRPETASEMLRALDAIEPSGANAVLPTHALVNTRSLAAIGLVIVLVAGAAWFTMRSDGSVAAAEDRSVAVLPFENDGRDSTQEYFADGLTEELISRLATTGLRVSGRNSVFTFKGTRPSARTVGAALGVGTVLTGNVRRLGDKLHVSAELADAKADRVLWTFNTDRQTSDVFAVQRDIVDSILVHFHIAGERARVDGTKSVKAYDHYLKGRFLAGKGTREALFASLKEFDLALAADPTFARAYTGIAYSWGWLSDGYLPPTEAQPRAAIAVRQALKLDSTLAEAWSATANYNVMFDWDWPRARREVDRALAINPNDPDAWMADSYVWIARGDRARAMKSIDRGLASDPLSSAMALQRMLHLAWGEHPDSALRFHQESALRAGSFEYGDSFLGFAQMKLGQVARAESTFKRAELILGHRSPGLGVLYARTGRRDAALALLNEIDAQWPATYIPPEMVAQIPAALGDTAGMYRWLERGLGVRSAWATLLGVWDPVLASHRNEKHYQSIMRRVGIVAP